MVRLAVVVAAGLFCSISVARADSCDNFKSPAQVLAGLSSDDPVARLGAKTCGLNSDDAAVRGVLLQQLLTGLTSMSFDLAPQPKDTEGAKMVDRFPSMVVGGITWSKDGRTFAGSGIGGHVGHVDGEFLGQGINISYEDVVVDPEKSDDQPRHATCSSTLTLQKGATQMAGSLRCEGFAPRLLITLGI